MPDVELALERVAKRVASGGHDIPEAVVRQRYVRGIRNFFEIYRPLADRWVVYDNSSSEPRLVAFGAENDPGTVVEHTSWESLKNQ